MVKNHFIILNNYRIRIRIGIFTKIESILVTHPTCPASFVQICPQLFEISCTQTDRQTDRQKGGENITSFTFGGGGNNCFHRNKNSHAIFVPISHQYPLPENSLVENTANRLVNSLFSSSVGWVIFCNTSNLAISQSLNKFDKLSPVINSCVHQ